MSSSINNCDSIDLDDDLIRKEEEFVLKNCFILNRKVIILYNQNLLNWLFFGIEYILLLL